MTGRWHQSKAGMAPATDKSYREPEKAHAVADAVIQHVASAISVIADNDTPITSSAKKNPPNGALNMAAIPAAAPHTIIARVIEAGRRHIRATPDPMAPPE